MDRLATEAAHQFLRIDAPILADPNLPRSASCTSLQATYIPRLDESPLGPARLLSVARARSPVEC